MKNKIIIFIILFIVFFLLSYQNIYNICKIYPSLGSDDQSLLFWRYSAYINLHPLKDVFYPYGLLNYLRDQNLFFSIIYLSIAPSIFALLSFIFIYLFKNKFYTTTSISAIYLFAITKTGFEAFSRYGLLVLISISFAYLIYFNKTKSKKFFFISGIMAGIVLPLINDIGFYMPLLFIAFSFVDKIIKLRILENISGIYLLFKKIKKQIGILILELLATSAGFILGLIPFFIYLIFTKSVYWFGFYLWNLREISLYAKTPFFHSINSLDNIFTFSVLIISIIYLSSRIFLEKKKLNLNNYFQIGLILVMILLEQKSVIRNIDSQISFIALILLILLFYEFYIFLLKFKIPKYIIGIYFINTCIAVLFFFNLHPLSYLVESHRDPIRFLMQVSKSTNKKCIEENINYLTSKDKSIIKTRDELLRLKDFNGKIYSFPSDPIFYLLLNQKPPYYPTIYEATPPKAQEMLIKYIKDQDIKYILLNTNSKSMQDEVPDVVRGRVLYDYIQSNYSFYEQVDNYKILRRK